MKSAKRISRKASAKYKQARGPKKVAPNVLWLLPDGFTTNREKYAKRRMVALKFNETRCTFTSVHKHVKGCWAQKGKSKTLKITPPKVMPKLLSYLDKLIQHLSPDVIVINDMCAAFALFPRFFTNPKLQTYRGSKLVHDKYPDTVFIVIDDASKCYMNFETERINSDTFAWIFDRDLKKVIRHADGTQLSQRPLDYRLVTHPNAFYEARDWLRNSMAIAFDCETSGATISCISFVGISHDGVHVRGWTFPVFAGYTTSGAYWPRITDEYEMWDVIKEICECDVVKVAQNGTYDITYLMKYGISVKDFLCDTQILMHSFCGSMEKGLGFLASIFLDDYVYWKDEIKGDGSANDTDKTGTLVPLTKNGCEIYWEYCAKDSYNTLYVAIRLLPLVAGMSWALDNYRKTMMLQQGPMLQCGLQGFRTSAERIHNLKAALQSKALDAHRALLTAVDDPLYNPRSPKQAKKLFFDILNVKPFKGAKRVTEEKALRRMCVRHPVADVILRLTTEYKRPVKLLETLNTRLMKGRFMYSLNASGTWTGRASSSKHAFWIGSNAQNMSKKVRPMCVADEGCWIVPIDYSQSDAYFVAFESEDENYIRNMKRNMNEGFDTHSFHVELLLGVPYDEVVAGKKSKDPAVVHPVTGSRNIIKRVVHGKNYDMKKKTMLTTVGVVSMIAAAVSVGYKNATQWLDPKLERFTEWLGNKYDAYYPDLSKWKDNLVTQTHENKNKVEAYGGRTHYVIGNCMRDTTGRIRRQTSAFKGQGGTAGNINRSVLSVYYDKHYLPRNAKQALGDPSVLLDLPPISFHELGVGFYNQVHDEIIFKVPFGKEYLIDNLLSIMEKKITIKGRTFHVPCEAELGLSWGIHLDWEGYSETKDFDYYHAKAMDKERAFDKALNEKGIKL